MDRRGFSTTHEYMGRENEKWKTQNTAKPRSDRISMEPETIKKFDEIKRKMQAEMGSKKKGIMVGLIGDLGNMDSDWLCQALSSKYFTGIIKKFKLVNTFENAPKVILKMTSSCTINIFICRGYTRGTFPIMRWILRERSESENLIIILHNLEDSSEREKSRILEENGDRVRYKENVFLFSKKELGFNSLDRLLNEGPAGSVRLKKKKKGTLSIKGTFRRKHKQQNPQINIYDNTPDMEEMSSARPFHSNGPHQVQGHEKASPGNKFKSQSEGKKSGKKYVRSDYNDQELQDTGTGLKNHKWRPSGSLRTFPTYDTGHGDHSSQRREIKHLRVGIFSRATDRDYSWLVKTLRSEEFSSLVANVKSCLLYNNQNFQEFLDDISQCTVGILYHSRNRGRVNFTNVTDSLYDEELETLHKILGKENVLVVIDDLEDSGDYRKKGILQEQHDIANRAADLLLVSQDDKMDPWLLRRKTDQLKAVLRGAGSALSSGV